MTNKEAIKEIDEVLNADGMDGIFYLPDAYREALNMAVVALNKAEPKPPQRYIWFGERGAWIGYCPSCGQGNSSDWEDYCKTCGQAIDWSVCK